MSEIQTNPLHFILNLPQQRFSVQSYMLSVRVHFLNIVSANVPTGESAGTKLPSVSISGQEGCYVAL